jgi:hydrogenase expression/formation protein HypC
MARVDFDGIAKSVCIEHVPTAEPGDYVLVHVGFAIAKIDEQEALKLLEYFRNLKQADGQ